MRNKPRIVSGAWRAQIKRANQKQNEQKTWNSGWHKTMWILADAEKNANVLARARKFYAMGILLIC